MGFITTFHRHLGQYFSKFPSIKQANRSLLLASWEGGRFCIENYTPIDHGYGSQIQVIHAEIRSAVESLRQEDQDCTFFQFFPCIQYT